MKDRSGSGMKQDDVLSRLAQENTLKAMPGMKDKWCVQPKGFTGLPYDCATVGFSNGKVYSVKSALGDSDDTSTASLMSQLYVAIARADKEGIPVQIHAGIDTDLPGQQRFRSLSISIGRKKYEIEIQQPVGISGTSYTTLSESLYELPRAVK